MTTKARKLDSIDRKLLYILQRDGRISNVELAEQVALSPTPCLERVRRLEKEGYIKQYVALLDANKLQSNTQAFIQVLLTSTTTDNLKKFGDLMRGITEVESCHMVAGGFDYLLKIRCRDMAAYRSLLGDVISYLPAVQQTSTFPVIEEVKESGLLRIDHDLSG